MATNGAKRALLVLVAMMALAAPALVASGANAQYGTGPTVWFDRISVPQGGVLNINSSGWQPGASIKIMIFSDPVDLGASLADSLGNISTSWTVPADFPLGAHSVQLTGLDLAGSLVTVTGTFDVTPLAGAIANVNVPAGSTLPVTGSSNTEQLAMLAGVLVLGGAGLTVWSRRRQQIG